jgi:hypothetical protein
MISTEDLNHQILFDELSKNFKHKLHLMLLHPVYKKTHVVLIVNLCIYSIVFVSLLIA